VFDQVQRQLQQHGYLARCGRIIDASMPRWCRRRFSATSVSKPRLSRKAPCRLSRNVTNGPEGCRVSLDQEAWPEPPRLQAAREHRQALQGHPQAGVTHATVADTTVFEPLLDPSNTSRDVYADRGNPSEEREHNLTRAGWRVHIQRRGTAQRGVSDTQKQRNGRIATPRAVSNMCSACWPIWAASWCGAWASCAAR
jgi:hypothetical protein